MPNVIPYLFVLENLKQQGLKSLYFNSGAFWFDDGIETVSRGWIGPADASISSAAKPLVRQAPEPYPQQLADLFVAFWKQWSVGPLWIMPKSHWSYELQFGSRDWLPNAMKEIGVDPNPLMLLNNAPAIEFAPSEGQLVNTFVRQLLKSLVSSDFQAVFADGRTICTIHSRAQLWWTTVDSPIVAHLDELLPPNGNVPC